ncbi:methionyl-tRNA synthetase [Penicillium malachiteum]|nr:methionyl-tRNA synthetase [Penicillium malachiteum]
MAQTKLKRGAIFPVPGERNILTTSALPYVNNVPHLGNLIGSTLSADVFARHCRSRGYNTLYVVFIDSIGTDEYDKTSETRALIEKCTPQQLFDKYHAIHDDVYKWFNISFDTFGRTTTPLQTEITQERFLKLHQNAFLKEEMTAQLYCEQHQSFLADRFVQGECPSCGYQEAYGDQCDLCSQLLDPLELKNPRCKIDEKLQLEIAVWFQQAASCGAWSNNGKEITSAWLKEGLKPRSITRDIKWGTPVPLPGYKDKVIYAWFNACIGYVSITANYTEDWQKWWQNPDDVQLYQFLGKDNVSYHTVIFPGTQIGTRETWTTLHHLSTTDYLTYKGGKFSKSRGIGEFGDSAQKTDVWRYYLISHRSEIGDTEFNWDSFISANNNILLKNLGNFVNRVVKFFNSAKFNNIVPDYTQYHQDSFETWKKHVGSLLTDYTDKLEAVKIRAALATVLQLFLQSNNLDNKLAARAPLKFAAVIGLTVNLIHLLASLLCPFMPETADSINAQLNAAALPIPDDWDTNSIKPGHEIGKANFLFSSLKPQKGPERRGLFGGQEAQKAKGEGAARKAAKKASKGLKAREDLN